MFGDHPLGRPIIGRAPVIRDTPVETIAAFHARRYVPGSVVIAAAGSVDHDQIVELAERTLGGLRRATRRRPIEPAPPIPLRPALPAQGHRAGARLPRRRRPPARRRAAVRLRVLDAIFGGLSSSRLFQAVREERGLAYSVYSFSGQYADTGPDRPLRRHAARQPAEAMQVVGEELARLREQPATEEELARARENVKARVVLALESTGSRMNRLGASLLFGLPLLETDEVIARFDAVTLDDLRELTTSCGRPSGCRRPASARTSRRSAPPSPASARAPASRHDPRRGRRRRGPHGADGVRRDRGADDLELTGRADPVLGTAVADVLGGADVLVDFTRPDTALDNARAALEAGVHVVIGTSGFDLDGLREAARVRAPTPSSRPTSRSARC